MAANFLDAGLVDAYCSGDGHNETELAEQVARVLPFRASLPNPTVAALSRLVACLDGEERLLPWPGERPGVPRIVATVYTLIGLLDRLSNDPAVADALPEALEQGLPAMLQAHLVPAPMDPHTSRATLASLGGQLELMLGEERYTAAVELSSATVDLLRQVVSPADDREQVERLRADLDALRSS